MDPLRSIHLGGDPSRGFSKKVTWPKTFEGMTLTEEQMTGAAGNFFAEPP